MMTLIPNSIAGSIRRGVALMCLASALIFSAPESWAQSSDSSSSSSGASSSSTSSTSTQGSGTTSTTGSASGTTDPTMESPSGEARIPPPTSLQTGQPLWGAISPLRWGHLSLLSASFVNVYDTNYNLGQQSASSSNVEMLSGIAAFSIRKNRSSVDLQWRPEMWYANSRLNKNFLGNMLDFQTSYAFSARTTMTVIDRFNYTPELSPLSQGGLSANYTNLLLLLNPFLATGTKQLINNLGVTVEHVVDGQNKLSFTGTQAFVRLSQPPFTPPPKIVCLPGLPFCFIQPGPPPKGPLLQERPTLEGGVTWTHQADARNTYKVLYNVDREWLRGTYEADTLYHHIGLGYDRMLTEKTSLNLEGGPTFSQSRSQPSDVVTNHVAATGSITLFHSFQQGGLALSAARSYNFSGLFSDSANTRLDFTVTRMLTRKWELAGGASYIRQEFSFASPANGTTEFVTSNYRLTRMLSFFSAYYYLRTAGSIQPMAPRQSISAGVSWSWSPDMNHY